MKKTIAAIVSIMMTGLVIGSVPAVTYAAEAPQSSETAQDQTQSDEITQDQTQSDEKFSYVHDPRTNPEAMKDIIEDPDAVYGFSPDPESERLGDYADYDWSDPKLVESAKKERKAYHDSMESMIDILYKMRDENASIEEMARAVSNERNRVRIEAYKDNPEGLEDAKKSNLKNYGHEEGPTPEELYEKYGSWITVLQKAFSPNLGMDVCCGLYDEYYLLYIELGLAPDDTVGADATAPAAGEETSATGEATDAAAVENADATAPATGEATPAATADVVAPAA